MKARIATHAIAIVAGIALAASFTGKHAPSSVVPAQDDAKAGKLAGTSSDTHAERRDLVRKPHAEDFKAAWDAVVSKPLTFGERMGLQRALLEKWAEVDLQGAMDAAMAEAWDNDFNPGFEMMGTSGNHYVDSFRKAFADRPLDSWKLISSGRYGVGSEILRKLWINSVAAANGPMVLSVIGEMPNGKRTKELAVAEAMRYAASNPERQAAVLAKLLEFPADEQTERWIQKASVYLPTDGDPTALREQWSTLPAGTQRTLAMMKWSASLKMADDAVLRGEWTHVPSEQRAAAVDALLSSTSYDTKSLLTILDLTMEAGQWTKLSKEGHEKLSFNSAGIEPVKLAEWAMKLPEREETVEVFHRSVDRYISEDMPRAKAWLEQMEPGDWHRERGLAEYSQQALRSHNDPEASRWALDQISDPALKEKAEGWRRDWERENGRAN